MKAPTVVMIPVSDLVTDGQNLRREEGEVEELQTSMGSIGMLQPIIVRPVNGFFYEVVAGHRRLKAAVASGMAEVPCDIREFDEGQKWEARLAENLNRRNLTPSEEGRIYHHLCVEGGYTQREIAGMAGRSQSHIAKRLALLTWPRDLIAKIDRGEVTLQQAERKMSGRTVSAHLGKRGKALDRERDGEPEADTRVVNVFTLEEFARFFRAVADDEWASGSVRNKARQLLRSTTQALSTEQVGGGIGEN